MVWRPLPPPDGAPPVRISAPVERVLGSLGAPPPAALALVFEAWSELVGPAIGSATRPVSLEEGLLVVAVPDGAWASQLRWMEQDLLRRLAERLGPGTVQCLAVRVGGA